MKIAIVLSVVLLGGYWVFQQNSVGKSDIYVDRLVYLKNDNILFTGTLEVEGKASYYSQPFCNGIPCGEWYEHQNGGGIIHKGKYLDKNILSESTHELFATDTFLINHWQEGELPTIKYPPYLTIFILKDDAFFQVDIKQYGNIFTEIANAVMNDTHGLKYDYLTISFGTSVFETSKCYAKEYKLVRGELQEMQRE